MQILFILIVGIVGMVCAHQGQYLAALGSILTLLLEAAYHKIDRQNKQCIKDLTHVINLYKMRQIIRKQNNE